MDDQEIDLRALLGVLQRQLHLVVLCVVAGLAIGIAGAFTAKPEFSATALMFVDTAQRDLLEPDQIRPISASAENARVDSEVEIVKSAPTLLRVIEAEGLLDHAHFAPRPGTRQQILAFLGFGDPQVASGEEALLELVARLRNALVVQRRGQTYLIAIEAKAGEPAIAAQLANAIAAAHIDLQREAKAASLIADLDLLAPQVAAARGALIASERAMDLFFDDHVEELAAQASEPVLVGLRAELVDRRDSGLFMEDVIERATIRLAERDYGELVEALGSPMLREIAQRQRAVLARMALVPSLGASAPVLDAELHALQRQFESVARNEIATLETALVANQVRVASLRDQIRENLAVDRLPPQVLARIYELQQAAMLTRGNYERLLVRVGDLRARAELQQADSRIVAAAMVPLEPSSLHPFVIIGFLGLLGLGLGLGVALVADTYTGGFTSQEQLEAVTRREVATGIPQIKPVRHEGGALAPSFSDAVILAPLSSYAESLRRLRLRLDLRLPVSVAAVGPKQGRVIVVSSSVSVEGKTTTALGLARTYGLAGQRVLIIDADLRHPALFRHLDAAPVAGLLDYLTGALAPEGLVTAVGTDALSGISTVVNARASEGPTEHLLTNRAFRQLISAARKSFDVIIIDTPPIGTVVDGVYAMQFADAVILLTRYAHTRQRDVMRALAVLERARPDMPPVLMAMTQQPDSGPVYGERYDTRYVVVQ